MTLLIDSILRTVILLVTVQTTRPQSSQAQRTQALQAVTTGLETTYQAIRTETTVLMKMTPQAATRTVLIATNQVLTLLHANEVEADHATF